MWLLCTLGSFKEGVLVLSRSALGRGELAHCLQSAVGTVCHGREDNVVLQVSF